MVVEKISKEGVPMNSLKRNTVGTILSFSNDQLASKMIAIGILPGHKFKIMQVAPMGGGMYIKINGFNIAVRISEASQILVKPEG